MKILVATKRVQDYNVKVRPKSDGSDVDIDGIKMGINPFDENALEEALRIKEKIQSTEISVVSIGDSKNQDVLRHGLAMGADRAILINTESPLQPLGVAKVLKGLVEKEKPDLILLGKLALDSDAGQTGQMLAGLLNYPQGTFVSKIEINNNKLTITREIDGGTNVLEMNLPAVLTADLRLNEPRFVKLPNLMMARKKKIEEIKSSDLATDTQTNQEILEVTIPPSRKAGIKVKSVKELLDKLKDQEGIKL
ncbi:MAG: electron transfer flavoprotein subunit beta/FixA family protein [Nitrosomonadales bacterium]|jgi:electron transfer flavoprotein beta subunit|nr:electron transfer flavoprotein subunit beta/FixA family protein [Nitrosomonadales bacterium]